MRSIFLGRSLQLSLTILTAIITGITILDSGLRVQAQIMQNDSTKAVVLIEVGYNFT